MPLFDRVINESKWESAFPLQASSLYALCTVQAVWRKHSWLCPCLQKSCMGISIRILMSMHSQQEVTSWSALSLRLTWDQHNELKLSLKVWTTCQSRRPLVQISRSAMKNKAVRCSFLAHQPLFICNAVEGVRAAHNWQEMLHTS